MYSIPYYVYSVRSKIIENGRVKDTKNSPPNNPSKPLKASETCSSGGQEPTLSFFFFRTNVPKYIPQGSYLLFVYSYILISLYSYLLYYYILIYYNYGVLRSIEYIKPTLRSLNILYINLFFTLSFFFLFSRLSFTHFHSLYLQSISLLHLFYFLSQFLTMKLLCAILCLGSTLASSIHDSHQLRLPFVPSSDNIEDGVRSRLVSDISSSSSLLY